MLFKKMILALTVIYLLLALKNVYKTSWTRSICYSLLIITGYILVFYLVIIAYFAVLIYYA